MHPDVQSKDDEIRNAFRDARNASVVPNYTALSTVGPCVGSVVVNSLSSSGTKKRNRTTKN